MNLCRDPFHAGAAAPDRLKPRPGARSAAWRALVLALLIGAPGAFARGAGDGALHMVELGPAAGEPPADKLERMQVEADYTKEVASPDTHVFDYVALSIGVVIVLVWLFGSGLVLRLRGDILPSRLKKQLDRLEALRLAIAASVKSLASAEPDAEWPEERRTYDGVATSANAFFERAKRGIKEDSMNEDSLCLELDRIVSTAERLAARLQSLTPAPFVAAERLDVEGLSQVQQINRNWERVFVSGEQSRLASLGQLNAMRWPNWSRLAPPPR